MDWLMHGTEHDKHVIAVTLQTMRSRRLNDVDRLLPGVDGWGHPNPPADAMLFADLWGFDDQLMQTMQVAHAFHELLLPIYTPFSVTLSADNPTTPSMSRVATYRVSCYCMWGTVRLDRGPTTIALLNYRRQL